MVMVLSLEMEHGCAHCPLPTCLLGGYVFARPWPGINASLLTHRGALCPGWHWCSHPKVFSFDCVILSERDL